MNAKRVHIIINPSDIIYLNSILDSYEGIGLMRTADEKSGEVVIYSSDDTVKNVTDLISALAKEGVKISVVSVDSYDTVEDKH